MLASFQKKNLASLLEGKRQSLSVALPANARAATYTPHSSHAKTNLAAVLALAFLLSPVNPVVVDDHGLQGTMHLCWWKAWQARKRKKTVTVEYLRRQHGLKQLIG